MDGKASFFLNRIRNLATNREVLMQAGYEYIQSFCPSLETPLVVINRYGKARNSHNYMLLNASVPYTSLPDQHLHRLHRVILPQHNES